jgi:HPt (histidine-containing phosphotransfer) domain-containing protein
MTTGTNEQLYDLSYLNQIFQCNQEMIHNIIQLFLEQVPNYINEMEICVQNKDFFALHPLAHKAKSSIAMLGLRDMEERIIKIEKDSKEHQNNEGLVSLVSQVKSDCAAVYVQLQMLLNSQSAA